MQDVVVIPQEEDHFSIAKPGSRRHPVYVGATSIISALEQVEQERQKLTLQLDGGIALSVAPPQHEETPRPAEMVGDMFEDLSRGVRFRLPTSAGWSDPEDLTFWDTLQRVGLGETQLEAMKLGMQVMPMGPMVADSSVIYVGYGKPFTASLTDTSTTKQLEVFIKRIQALMGESFDEEMGAELRKSVAQQNLGVTTFTIQNRFSIVTMDKALAQGSPIEPTLANLYVLLTKTGGGPVDRLVANDHSIMWGSTQTIRNVEIDGDLRELTINAMYLLTEGDDCFYQVEIFYSPQSENPLTVWNELQEMAQSFRVLRSPARPAIRSLPGSVPAPSYRLGAAITVSA